MSRAEGSVIPAFVEVFTDPATWIWAAGASAISAAIALLASRSVQPQPPYLMASLAAAVPVFLLIGAIFVFRKGELGSTVLFLVEPGVLLGLTIWFISGWLSAYALAARLGVRRKRKIAASDTRVFE
jgi:hypothetical protein